MTTSRSAALLSLALASLIISARAATADTINLLRPARATAPQILIDHSKGPWPSDDEATAMIDGECVAVGDQGRDRRIALGAVNWRAGQLAWRWEARAQPDIVYVICVDRARRDPGFGAGLQLATALSWSGRPIASAARGQSFADSSGTARPDVELTAIVPGETPEAPWSSSEPPPSWPSDPPLDTNLDVPLGLPVPVGSISFPTAPTSDIFPGMGGNSTPPGMTFSPPIVLDSPPDMVPTPEPGTFLLMGTGLAAAWRLARRRREE